MARLVTGGVWIVAGALKLPDPAASVRAVRAYDLLPEAIVPTVGHLLPVLEVVVGVCLVLGLLTRAAAVISALLFLAFIVGIASAWARGLQIECGCFGGGGYVRRRHRRVPVGDRPRRRPAAAVAVAGLAASNQVRGRRPAVPPYRKAPGCRRSPLIAPVPCAPQAALAAQERAERKRQMLVVGGVVVALVLIVVVGYLVTSGRDSTGETPEATPNGVTDSYAVVVGDESAPKTITLFEDLQCPVCKAFQDATGDQVDKAVADGKVKVEYRMIAILDGASTTEYSSRALNALMVVLDTSGQDAYLEYQRLLYENQPAEGSAGLTDDQLIEYAVQAGADEDAVRGPIEDRVFQQWIDNATDQASKDGVHGTPTVLIDGKPAGSTPQESAQAVLEAVS